MHERIPPLPPGPVFVFGGGRTVRERLVLPVTRERALELLHALGAAESLKRASRNFSEVRLHADRHLAVSGFAPDTTLAPDLRTRLERSMQGLEAPMLVDGRLLDSALLGSETRGATLCFDNHGFGFEPPGWHGHGLSADSGSRGAFHGDTLGRALLCALDPSDIEAAGAWLVPHAPDALVEAMSEGIRPPGAPCTRRFTLPPAILAGLFQHPWPSVRERAMLALSNLDPRAAVPVLPGHTR